jgi:hypothetical protein
VLGASWGFSRCCHLFVELGGMSGLAFSEVKKSPPRVQGLGKVHIEAVYFLRAFVAHQKRRVIRSQAYP